jgi:tetratricopeptide (TPR) repeat protein
VRGRGLAHDVFISYSSKDKPTADAACAVIEGRGMRCWIAPRDILPGQDWGEAIVDAISASRVFLLVFSSHANDSQQIKREVERAVHHALPIIPLRIEDVLPQDALEYFLSTPHWLDAFNPPMARHLEHLADVIRRLLDGGKEEPPQPVPAPAPRAKTWVPATIAILAAGLAAVVLGPMLIRAIKSRPSAPPAAAAAAAAQAPMTAPPPAAPPVEGGLDPKWATCVNEDADVSIRGCTALIRSGDLDRRNMGVAYFNRGFSYERKGDYDLAVADYSRVLRASPNDPEALTNRGQALSEGGHYEAAVTDFTKAIGLNAENFLAYSNRGYALMMLGRYAQALPDLDRAIHLSPTLANAFVYRCAVRARMGTQLDAALADCNRALSHLPKYAEGLDARGLTHLRRGEADAAIADYTAALQVQPGLASALYGRALAQRAKGGQDSADLAAAQAADPSVAATFAGFGVS